MDELTAVLKDLIKSPENAEAELPDFQRIVQSINPQRFYQILIEVQDAQYNNAVQFAARLGKKDIVELLINSCPPEKRNDLQRIQNRWGSTPTHRAAFHGRTDTIDCMKRSIGHQQQWYEVLQIQNKYGSTSVHLTVYRKHPATLEYLLNSVSIDQRYSLLAIQDSAGDTALHCAIRDCEGESRTVILYKIFGSVTQDDTLSLLEIPNNEGLTPTQISEGHSDIIKCILHSNSNQRFTNNVAAAEGTQEDQQLVLKVEQLSVKGEQHERNILELKAENRANAEHLENEIESRDRQQTQASSELRHRQHELEVQQEQDRTRSDQQLGGVQQRLQVLELSPPPALTSANEPPLITTEGVLETQELPGVQNSAVLALASINEPPPITTQAVLETQELPNIFAPETQEITGRQQDSDIAQEAATSRWNLMFRALSSQVQGLAEDVLYLLICVPDRTRQTDDNDDGNSWLVDPSTEDMSMERG